MADQDTIAIDPVTTEIPISSDDPNFIPVTTTINNNNNNNTNVNSSDNSLSSSNTVEELYPIALLMDELRHDDVASRVQAMKRLDTIAIALGPERSRDELIPFLEDVIPEDEDEVIAIAAEELGNFIPYIGGSNFATLLIPVLEKISACEEPIVREKAINSLNNIANSLSLDQITNNFIPLINRLAKERWFSLHIAATGLFKSILIKINDQQRLSLLKLFQDLIHDDSPMVRKSSAKELPILIDLLNSNINLINDDVWNLITNMYESLVNDNQDSVKFLSVDVLISILKYLKISNKDNQIDDLFNSLITLINDPSWRVRYMVAERFDQLSINFNNENFTLKLVPNIISLMKDNEAEVRKAISKQLPTFSKLVNNYDNSIVLKEIVPIVNQLSMDESENVRSSLASEITGLAPILGKDLTIQYLLPIFVEMLKDEFSDVRLNIISNLQIVNEVIGIQLLSESLMPAITALAHDKLWRVRLAIIEQIPLLAEQLGISFFDKTLGELCLDWLWDPVFSIREAAVINLKKLTKFFGENWCKEEIINIILDKKENSKDFNNFICRITCLFTFDNLIEVVSPETVKDYLYPFIKELINDKVPNIRFNSAKSLLNVSNSLANDYKDIIIDEIKPLLEKLIQEDEDEDVRYFANDSLIKIEELL
jgi:serine/threonine-protein phosphatase 2A regulatory subunit A